MLALKEIKKWFPEELHEEDTFLLREYLQYEILKILFTSKYGHRFTFLGGTCLRIGYGAERLSEYLDFDNDDLTTEEFEDVAAIIKRGLELLGYRVVLKFVYKGAYHCNIKFPALLFDYKLSGHKEAKLLIKMDTEKQHYNYERKIYFLNKFGVQADIRITPIELLASQKIAAIMGRKRAKGRDFYDLTFILRQGKPDYGYLTERFEVATPDALRSMVQEKIDTLDFDQLTKDVSPFLFRREDLASVQEFPDFWSKVAL